MSSSRRNHVVEVPLTREQRYQQQEEMNEAREKLKQRYDNNFKKGEDLANKKRNQGIMLGLLLTPQQTSARTSFGLQRLHQHH